MKGTIEIVAGTGLDKNDIAEIQNAIEAALQGKRYEDVFSFTTTREIESDTSIYYLRISTPSGETADKYAGVQRRLQSSLLCHVEFAQSLPSSTARPPRSEGHPNQTSARRSTQRREQTTPSHIRDAPTVP
jgi:hypothetical protein